jgi:hypothetical protein
MMSGAGEARDVKELLTALIEEFAGLLLDEKDWGWGINGLGRWMGRSVHCCDC